MSDTHTISTAGASVMSNDTHAENKQIHVDIVFDGPPSHESGRFIEVENERGESIRFGEWIDRGDGYWALRVPRADAPPLPSDEPDSEGWVAWRGNESGKCPLLEGTRFKARFRCGAESALKIAPRFRWNHESTGADIIAYRVIEPATEPADDGVLSGADALELCAEEWRIGGDWWARLQYKNLGQWTGFATQGHVYCVIAHGDAIRRKPTTRHLIDAEGVRWEWPAPMTAEPASGANFYYASLTHDVVCEQWASRSYQKHILAAGHCHSNSYAARQEIAAIRALIAASKGSQS